MGQVKRWCSCREIRDASSYNRGWREKDKREGGIGEETSKRTIPMAVEAGILRGTRAIALAADLSAERLKRIEEILYLGFRMTAALSNLMILTSLLGGLAKHPSGCRWRKKKKREETCERGKTRDPCVLDILNESLPTRFAVILNLNAIDGARLTMSNRKSKFVSSNEFFHCRI